MSELTVNKVVDIAMAEVGYIEKKSNANLDDKTANAGSKNFTKYARDFSRFSNINVQGQAWCGTFVNWLFIKAYGVTDAKKLLCGFSAYTPTMAGYFKEKKQWHTSNPKCGDVIFFKNTLRICHTGLVYAVDANKVYTIEGNTSAGNKLVANGGGVAKKSYNLTYKSIAGYGRPNYDKATNNVSNKTAIPSVTPIVNTVQNPQAVCWDFFSSRLNNDFATAGILGNIQAESAYNSMNVQDSCEKKLGMNDVQYTIAVDSGTYKNFAKDSIGYGIAQWTYWTRKEALKKYTDLKHVSIGDLQAQLEFLWKELSVKTALVNALKKSQSVEQASNLFMTQFEKPKDQSAESKKTRAKFGLSVYSAFHKNVYTQNASVPVKATIKKYIINNKDYSGVFDPEFYMNKYVDLKAAFNNNQALAFEHFKSYGIKEGRQGSALFDPRAYKANNPDLAKIFGNTWSLYYEHYVTYGKNEGRKAI